MHLTPYGSPLSLAQVLKDMASEVTKLINEAVDQYIDNKPAEPQ